MKTLLNKLIGDEVQRKHLLAVHPLWINLSLAAITLFALGLCLWLFLDILASQKQFQLILLQHSHDGTILEKLNSIHQQEIWLDLLLLLPILVLGVMLFGFVTFYFKTTQQLREVQSIDNYILQSITRGVLTIDRQNRVTSCNRAMQEILGICRETCYLQPVESLLASDDPILEMLHQTGVREKNQEDEQELTYTRFDGATLPLRVTISALQDEKNRLIGSIILIKDLTPIRSLEERIRRQQRFAALGHLTRRIIHEIRNPLSAMDMNLQLLREHMEEDLESGLDDKIQRYFNIVFSELHRLDDILQSTHLSVHPPSLDASKLNIQKVLQEVMMKMQAELQLAGHQLVIKLMDEPVYIVGDKNLLIQVFINLFKNSMDAMRGKKGRIRVSCQINNKNQVLIKIEDSGRGIDWQNFPRIFDPYYTTKAKGTGLGLSIVHNIITEHRGDIHVSSWVGEGTVFELYFPLLLDNQ